MCGGRYYSMTREKSEVGLIGLGVMGQGVALNITGHGYSLSAYNRSWEKTEALMSKAGERSILPCRSLEEFTASLKKPRKIMLLVKAGDVTDNMINALIPLLDSDDIIIDLGNSYYEDTERRQRELNDKAIRFLGTGISGGEQGALNGPAIMAGGNESAWNEVKHILQDIAADNPDGGSCCGYFGEGGAGHFIKMVHNGIEYGYMEIISEIYSVIRSYYGLSPEEIADVFDELCADENVSSYLVDITAKILRRKDEETGKSMVDVISDEAGNKGTGKWTSQCALQMGVSIPVLTEALFARYTSTEYRAKELEMKEDKRSFDRRALEEVKMALEFSQYLCFENGLRLIKKASEEKGWNVNFFEILKTWENGCIIRTAFSGNMKYAYSRDNSIRSLISDEQISHILRFDLASAKSMINKAMQCNIPSLSLSAAVNYYMAYECSKMPTVMIQAQRDFFGAHTYKRVDKEGMFHTKWE